MKATLRRLIREYVYSMKTGFPTRLRMTLQSLEQLKGTRILLRTGSPWPGSERFIIVTVGVRRRRTRVLVSGSTADLAEALESQFTKRSRSYMRWLPDLVCAVPRLLTLDFDRPYHMIGSILSDGTVVRNLLDAQQTSIGSKAAPPQCWQIL
jgi:hypothetical protein